MGRMWAGQCNKNIANLTAALEMYDDKRQEDEAKRGPLSLPAMVLLFLSAVEFFRTKLNKTSARAELPSYNNIWPNWIHFTCVFSPRSS